jgi:hypothetical protein
MDAWVGVVGTLLGAIVGAGATFLIERDRRSHDDRHRFAEVKRGLYSDYSSVTQRIGLEIVQRMHELHAVFTEARPPSEVRAVADLSDAWKLEEALTLVVPDEVYDAARLLMSALARLREISAADPEHLSASPWESGSANSLWDAHDRFLTLARADLGVGHRPISTE